MYTYFYFFYFIIIYSSILNFTTNTLSLILILQLMRFIHSLSVSVPASPSLLVAVSRCIVPPSLAYMMDSICPCCNKMQLLNCISNIQITRNCVLNTSYKRDLLCCKQLQWNCPLRSSLPLIRGQM